MMGLPTPQGIAANALAALAVAAVGFGAGWAVNGWRLGTQLAQEQRQEAQEHGRRLGLAVDSLKAAQAQRDTLARQLADSDKTHTANLTRLTNENETLRTRVAAGRSVVRVAAVCPGTPVVPSTAAGSGVDSGTGAVLTPAAGQDFFNLRRDAARVGEKLAACQDAVKRMTGQ